MSYLAGKFSCGGDDDRPEAELGGLLEVRKQRETEGQRLARSRRSAGQELATLKDAPS